MVSRSRRSIDTYMRAGAEMRLYKTLGTKLFVDISKVLSVRDQEKLGRAMDRIDEICSKAEDKMFQDYPQLPCKYIDVFYGDTDDTPRNDVDEKVIRMAREAADGLFERKGD